MDSITLQDIGALPGDEQQALKTLLRLDRLLDRGQHVFIMTFKPGVAADAQSQQRAQKDLSRILDAAEKHAAAHGVTAQEADAAVNEAMRHIRPRPA